MFLQLIKQFFYRHKVKVFVGEGRRWCQDCDKMFKPKK